MYEHVYCQRLLASLKSHRESCKCLRFGEPFSLIRPIYMIILNFKYPFVASAVIAQLINKYNYQ